MKKNFIYLLLFFSLIAQAQVTPSYPTIKLTKTVEGVKQDSLLVVGTDKIVKHIPYSKISNIQEYATASALPLTGVAGKIYVVKNLNKIYRWNGTIYQEISADETTATIQAKRPLKTIENQSLEGSGNIDLSKSDVGLGNVDNTSDANKPISTATQTALNGKQNYLDWATPQDYGAVGDGIADDTAALQACLTNNSNVLLYGNYKTTDYLEVFSNQFIFSNNATITRSSTASAILVALNRENIQIKGSLTLVGSGNFEGTNSGIKMSGVDNFKIDGVVFKNIAGVGLWVSNGLVTFPRGKGGLISNIQAINCYIGMQFDYGAQGEYHSVVNFNATKCNTGVNIYAGNISITGGNIVDNTLGIYLGGTLSTNNSHGILNGVNINHNSNLNLYIQNAELGQSIIGCHFYGTSTNNIKIENSKGILFEGCVIDGRLQNTDTETVKGAHIISNCQLGPSFNPDIPGINYKGNYSLTNGNVRSSVYDNGGNVGIGTVLPTSRLSTLSLANVTAPTSGSGAEAGLFVGSQDNVLGLLFGASQSTGAGWIQSTRVDGTATNYPISLNPNGGGVSIGSTVNPGTNNLTVAGNINATSYTGTATLTGTPTAPTATAGTNTNQIATTAFVQGAIPIVSQTITNGVTDKSPSEDAVFDALATKAPISSVHNPITLGTANGLSLATQQLSLGLANSGVTGALSGTDWDTFNNKQDALGYTPENVANKATTLTASSTLYPTNNAVIVGLATKEDKANKVTSIGSPANDTNYPSELAVKNYADNLVVGMLNDRGVWDASVNAFPTTGGSGVGGAIRKGDMWYVSVAGTLGTKSVNVGDSFRALVNAPAQVEANWSILEANIGYVPANDSNVVHLAGAETITGLKTFNPSVSASSAVARGTYFTPKLSATANNDILVGLDINPTFTNGSFTGVKNISARFNGLADVRASGMGSKFSFGDGSLYFGWNNGNYLDIISADGLRVGNQASTKLQLFSNTGSLILQGGGTFTDDNINRLQVTGTVSSGTTALNNTPPIANNQLTRKDYVDTGLALKANLASPSLTGTPTAPTATAGANTTQIANAAFVTSAISTADSENVKLTGDQTISGHKSFSLTGKIDMQTDNTSPAISVTAIGSNGNAAAMFINNSSSPDSSALSLQTGLSGGVGNATLNVLNMSPIGTGIVSNASNGGVSISSQSGDGDSYISNITEGRTGRNYVGRNNGIETYSVDKIGNVIGNSYIKRSAPANNILLAGGGDIAQNTAFNKNFGTTAGTVVEGGTLGSNAYNSTPYLPLSGGTLSGALNGTSATFSSSVTATKLSVSTLATGTQTLLELGEPGYVATSYGSALESSSATGLFSLFNYNAGVKSTTPVLSWSRVNSNMTFGGTVTATSYTATSLPVFENNALASSLAVGQFYRTSTGVLMVKF